jgi:putative ABC transport system permease protein
MSDFLTNARYALRMLLRHKRFSALAIISLGVAIALNTTMYSVLDTMIAPKLAMRDPDRLYTFIYYGDFRGKIPAREKYDTYRLMRSAESMTGAGRTPFADGFAQRGGRLSEVRVTTVLPNWFSVTGAKPSAGRLLNPTDLGLEGRPVVVSERFWKQFFADKNRFEPVTFNTGGGEVRTVVGVLPYEGDFPGSHTDVWQLPLPAEVPNIPPSIIRLKHDVTPDMAWGELETIRKLFAERTGERNPGDAGFRFFSATKPPFRVNAFHYSLIGAVVAVLLIACANLANLQLARGLSRARELATRVAVGATRRDIVSQLLVESAWLGAGGLALGGLLTVWGMRIVNANVPPTVADYMTHTQVSWRVLAFAVVATIVCLTLMGLVPAIRVSRVDVNELLKSGAGTGKSRGSRRQYGALVISEVAMALALLCSASLLMKAAISVMSFDPGFEERGLLTTYLLTSPASPTDRRTVSDRTNEAINAALSVKSVTHAAIAAYRSPKTRAVSYEGPGGIATRNVERWFSYQLVTADYMRTMKIQVIKGRDFTVGETQPAIIVDQMTANLFWPGIDPIGRMVKLDSSGAPTPWYRVVGVVRRIQPWFNPNPVDVALERMRGIGSVYLLMGNDTTVVKQATARERYTARFDLRVRTDDDPMAVAVGLRTALIEKVNGYVSVPQPGEASIGIARLKAKHGFMASLFTMFASLALGLAALGVYAIIAHMVAQRTREFGVRLAVGAGANDIRQLVLKEGNVLALAGIAGGLLMTAYSAKWVRAFVFDDYDRYDSRVFALASLVLFLTAWLASYIPARRAMRINPVEALRND